MGEVGEAVGHPPGAVSNIRDRSTVAARALSAEPDEVKPALTCAPYRHAPSEDLNLFAPTVV